MPLMASGSGHIVVCFGDLDQDQSVFLPQTQARALAQLRTALVTASTWEELHSLVPASAWSDVVERYSWGDEPPLAEGPFESSQISGFEDGDWPAWPAQEMLGWMPKEIQERFGTRETSNFNGDFLAIAPARAAEVAQALDALGFSCVRDDALIQTASGY
jgi:hypothetical protein